MEISIASQEDGGHNIPHRVMLVPFSSSEGDMGRGVANNRYEVRYTPQSSGKHEANILFNNQHIVGMLNIGYAFIVLFY